MLIRSLARLGSVAALLLSAGCMGVGYDRQAWAPPGPMLEKPPPEGPPGDTGYRLTPKPRPRQTAIAAADDKPQHEEPVDSGAKQSRAQKPGGAVASRETHTAGKAPENTADAHPLTPAEIRAAVPAQKVNNPKQTLSTAQIKSLWGGVIGHVHSVDVTGGKLKAVDANITAAPGAKPKIVRIDPSHLKYVRSRNLLLTTMSKPDIAKLPAADNP